MVAPGKRLTTAIDQTRQDILALKHPILESKKGSIEETDLDELERRIRQLQSQVASLK